MYERTDLMSDPPNYEKGDVVWVKFSGCWWPGEVQNEEDLPKNLLADFKKPPLVVVKFFEEDNYEYIKQWCNIRPYNCDKKTEFIKKGMVGYRAKLSHMEKFPKDIGVAEAKTDGNPDILSEPEFLPSKKMIYDDLFGSPSPKKSVKNKNASSTPRKNKPLITHRRFLGNDDYKAYILVQEIQIDRSTNNLANNDGKLNSQLSEVMKCDFCTFSTYSVDVMSVHNKWHCEDPTSTPKPKLKKFREYEFTDSEEPETSSPKPQKQRKKKVHQMKKSAYPFSNLLRDWSDSEEERPHKKKKSVKTPKHHGEKLTKPTSSKKAPKSKATQDDIKNCFDFDEEEEDDEILVSASSDRKIPRVIPEKSQGSISESMEFSEKEDESQKDAEATKGEIDNEKPTSVSENEKNESNVLSKCDESVEKSADTVEDPIESTFKELMEKTVVPSLDELAEDLKPEQNFHDARTIKFPDKGGTDSADGETEDAIKPLKKSFVTSFDDFEAGFKKINAEQGLDKKAISTTDSTDVSVSEEINNSIQNEESEALDTSKIQKKRKQLIVEKDSDRIVEFSKGDDEIKDDLNKTPEEVKEQIFADEIKSVEVDPELKIKSKRGRPQKNNTDIKKADISVEIDNTPVQTPRRGRSRKIEEFHLTAEDSEEIESETKIDNDQSVDVTEKLADEEILIKKDTTEKLQEILVEPVEPEKKDIVEPEKDTCDAEISEDKIKSSAIKDDEAAVEIVSKKRRGRSRWTNQTEEVKESTKVEETALKPVEESAKFMESQKGFLVSTEKLDEEIKTSLEENSIILQSDTSEVDKTNITSATGNVSDTLYTGGSSRSLRSSKAIKSRWDKIVSVENAAPVDTSVVKEAEIIEENAPDKIEEKVADKIIEEKVDLPVKKKRGRPKRNSSISKLENSELELSKVEMDYSTEDSQESLTDKEISLKESTEENSECAELSQDGEIGNKKVNKKWRRGRRKKRIFKKAPAKNNEMAETNADNNLVIEEKIPNEQKLDSLEPCDELKKLQEEVKESKEVQNNQIIDESNSDNKDPIKEKIVEESVATDSKDVIIENVSSPKVTDATPRKRGRPKKVVQEPPEESTIIKHSDSAILKINEDSKDKTDDDKTKTLKVIPPKKHKWPLRRSSRNNEDISIEAVEEPSASETVESTCSNKSSNNIVDELILPLKKSKRANEALKDDEEESVDEKDVIVSKKTKLELESKVSEETSTEEGVHPKKKKLYLETKVSEDIAETAALIAPKKKMQKLFETSQNVEKVETPLMSPLAKKKNFLFQQEVDLQKEEEVDIKNVEKSKNSSITEEAQMKNDKGDVQSGGSAEIEESKIEIVPESLEADKIMNIDKDTTAIKLMEESELVSLSGTPTVMTEQDLADVQVEITTDKIISEFPAEKDFEKATPKCGTTKSELLDILEGNSNSSANSSGSDRAFKSSYDNYNKKNTVQGIIDFEDAIPSQIVQTNKVSADSVILDSPKLLERLSMSSDTAKNKSKVVIQSDVKVPEDISKNLMCKISKTASGMVPKPGQKIIIKTARPAGAAVLASNVQLGKKPLILSDQILRPGNQATDTNAVQQGLKRQYEDIEDVETAFIIPKISKKSEEEVVVATTSIPSKTRNAKVPIGKATILQQTIIKPKNEIIPQLSQPSSSTNQMEQDDSIFDINSMPIVLSDDLLTPESIQNMPVVLSNEILPQGPAVSTIKAIDKPIISGVIQKKIIASVPAKQIILKTSQSSFGTSTKFITKSKNVSSTIKSGATAFLATGTTIDGQPTKYVLVPPSATPATTQVKTIKQTVVKKPSSSVVGNLVKASGSNVVVPQSDSNQLIGNKIMIVTNSQGHQARLVLTPQQQKALLQPGTKTTKTMIKCPLSKAILESVTTAGRTIISSKMVAVPYQLGGISSPSAAASASSSALRTIKNVVTTTTTTTIPKKIPPIQRSIANKPQKTILIKNSLGTTVRKVQGTDNADIDRQVAEQLKAIKASTRMYEANKSSSSSSSEVGGFSAHKPAATNVNKSTSVRKTFIKKPDAVKDVLLQKDAAIPALAPLSPHARTSQIQKQTIVRKTIEQATAGRSSLPKSPQKPLSVQHKEKAQTSSSDAEKRSESPVKQVVIQDGLGNLTTVTVGQILAIPSETVDGQPQSYMLVTVDESGNLTPLNNEALMSLDPSLRAGGDINNMVLQVDQGQGTVTSIKSSEIANTDGKKKIEEKPKTESKPVKQTTSTAKFSSKPEINEQATGHQLIITGDSQVTQKFLDSLSDGTTDLASILESAEGGSVIIQADGQEILISTNTSDQTLLEHHQESVFEGHKPNQDILAAALANTDVFQPIVDSHQHHHQSQSSSVIKDLPTQIISPSTSGLYPVQAGNVSETSLTLTSPIMSPLEIPSTNTKKINDEVDILSQVSKNVDLPITITDPTIVQTVANQQASVGLMELTLPLPESSISSGLNSPYSYSLPMLDESIVGNNQKGFSSSMPLLTEDVVEGSLSADNDDMKNTASSLSPNFGCLPILDSMDSSRDEVVVESLPIITEDTSNNKSLSKLATNVADRSIVEEGLLTLGGEMCSSLSEPPPDMFDLSTISNKEDEISSDLSSIVEPEETLSMNSENSEEIPIQPPIVAALSDLKRSGDEEDANSESSEEKKARFEE